MRYNIIFHDGESREISEEQKEHIYKLSSDKNIKGFELNGEFIFFSSISRIVKVETSDIPEFQSLPRPSYSFKRHLKHLLSVKKRFLSYFEGREIPDGSQKILDKINEAIQRVKNGENVDMSSPAKLFGYLS